MTRQKYMLGGQFVKLNGKFVWSCGYFAFDGCHKVYVVERRSELKEVLDVGCYRLYPIEELKETVDRITCPLRFVSNWRCNFDYAKQFGEIEWSYVNINEKGKTNG